MEEFRAEHGELRSQASIMKIPVMFHIIHDGSTGKVDRKTLVKQVCLCVRSLQRIDR